MSRIAHPWRLSPALLKREGLPKPTLNPPSLSKSGSLAMLLAMRLASSRGSELTNSYIALIGVA